MLFRRSASLVDAVQIDGTEAALRAVSAIPRLSPAMRGGEMEVSTSCGRRIARRGSWITRDTSTSAVRLYENGRFQAMHEAVR
jgi:hypothetical protein